MISEILAQLQAVCQSANKFKSIEITEGRFSIDDVMMESFRPPAARIAFLGARKSTPTANEERRFDATFAVFVITEGAARTEQAAELAEWLAVRIELWRPDVRGAGLPRDVELDALASLPGEKRRVSIWAVSWKQIIRLGTDQIGAGPHDHSVLLPADPDNLDIDLLPADMSEMP